MSETVQQQVRAIRKSTLFRLKDSGTAPVWVRGEYVRKVGRYSAYKFDDVNHERLFSGERLVFTGFTF